jgi:ADP-heptose:LPS heptosyltransferase
MHFLVIRTSAMGDVALTVPVIGSLKARFPEIEVTLLTKSDFRPFFNSIPSLRIFEARFNDRHKGLTGLFSLYRELKKNEDIDYIIDLHDVLRSKILRWLFRLSGIKSAVIDKGRAEKRKLVKGKIKIQLKHSVYRYLDVFSKAGLIIDPDNWKSIIPACSAYEKIAGLIDESGVMNIGIAPYARHHLKTWPEEYMIRLASMISEKYKIKFWLFGGKEEYDRLSRLQVKIPDSYLVSGNLTLGEELALMSRLDLMLAMDSANMHLAALTGMKAISIWGGTDPLAGFGAWNQPEEYSLRIAVEDLTCRPCTIYGKGNCRRGDLACMKWLTPEKIFNKLVELDLL